jgi:cytochrome c-type biogenesis protein CcmH/NrfG
MELARRFPKDDRVNFRLSRLLHQRALMHYGSGAIATAIADWQRVLAIDPSNQKARGMLERALAESQPTTRKQ